MADLDCLRVRHLGRQPYGPVFAAMKAFTEARDGSTPDEFWLVEHDPVFTQGQAGKEEHLLMPGDIPVVQVDRGGQVTYHGPGQIVGYPMLDIRRRDIGVRELVSAIENAIVATLAACHIEAYPKPDAPGVYVRKGQGEAKIASLGIRIRRGCSYHGLSLNVDMDLAPFRRINPCGYQGLEMTRISDLATPAPAMAAVEAILLDRLVAALGYRDHRPLDNPLAILAEPAHE
ncbi:MAG: lipoyl(octanoyl) transferase LipB [Porticoccaceae bacterium]|jgi:lipoyl(octanoyl) transferase|nr:lipoyl(octanoyl) transferase LipB [Porticoccaceae bacterium]MEA3300729.1 lipoyl(octanoyl) transferase LipB [Pseudomonadota bacterium]HLS98656.1 lipoyl(octanoyl) transferase LipB [Porticoccaceae bacterium]